MQKILLTLCVLFNLFDQLSASDAFPHDSDSREGKSMTHRGSSSLSNQMINFNVDTHDFQNGVLAIHDNRTNQIRTFNCPGIKSVHTLYLDPWEGIYVKALKGSTATENKVMQKASTPFFLYHLTQTTMRDLSSGFASTSHLRPDLYGGIYFSGKDPNTHTQSVLHFKGQHINTIVKGWSSIEEIIPSYGHIYVLGEPIQGNQLLVNVSENRQDILFPTWKNVQAIISDLDGGLYIFGLNAEGENTTLLRKDGRSKRLFQDVSGITSIYPDQIGGFYIYGTDSYNCPTPLGRYMRDGTEFMRHDAQNNQ
ncbi:hypothetical protein [Candidatus Nucleicultrix amoebiphila]|uniref:Uncharacterized protein n=1 Tax=Candidatus Nucleicultrix amoebiphila FS5 TaxID=1414854 RepID=A0A1W6N4Y7_9PROT|nr:hypothetical protein [Candidatus Nucleicultrix amoebiphila]ARN84940.1 hypothetical protein GQ61_06185 [Candidatus Nucleicultrix amoebiphila FS5]